MIGEEPFATERLQWLTNFVFSRRAETHPAGANGAKCGAWIAAHRVGCKDLAAGPSRPAAG